MKRRRLARWVDDLIDELIDQRKTAREITDEVARRSRPSDPTPPDIRTIHRRIAARDKGESPLWEFDPLRADPSGAQVLEVLADLVAWSEGRRQSVSEDEAAAIVGIRQIAADLPPRLTFRLARHYLARRAASAGTADLDLWLAFAPWRPGARERYEAAVGLGIERAPVDTPLFDSTPLTSQGVQAGIRRLILSEVIKAVGSDARPADAPSQEADVDVLVELALANVDPEAISRAAASAAAEITMPQEETK